MTPTILILIGIGLSLFAFTVGYIMGSGVKERKLQDGNYFDDEPNIFE